MPNGCWNSLEGLSHLETILKSATPLWPNGPRAWQVQATAHVLDRRNQLVIAGCGEGKTAAMYLHVLVHQYLRDHPDVPRFGLEVHERPVVIDVTPLTDLAESQVAELERMGISALSLDSQCVSDAKALGIDLYESIKKGEYAVVITSPERLNSPEFDGILRCEGFLKNMALYSVDEAHIAIWWSKSFRLAYGEINRVVARIPPRVPVLLMTATLTRDGEKELLGLMGFQTGQYETIRRPVERPNVRTIFKTLHHGLGGEEFPDLAWVATCRKKTLIYCKDFELCWRLASYLRRLLPLATRKRNVRVYNGLTDDTILRRRERADTL
ncbi:P-loop containing nucleoside triphosphate hydrolase protein [Auriscalpium vulgare]|uniref:P-loop containing nucleoside triphosphate hydrolase protein n=1 Tax=Auriscalpium vulgare TaxID=40419 RepID=A0ACB8R2G9_9AGAM|nr:P-loop containing nucleoside triphosphate hydrolase protein [Auriscalpium vulgare]